MCDGHHRPAPGRPVQSGCFPPPGACAHRELYWRISRQELPYPLPTAPAATVLWIVVTGTGGLVCLWGVWLYLKARRAQHEVRT
jgi:hypothetical protein